MDQMDPNGDPGYLHDTDIDYGDQAIHGDLPWPSLDPNHFTANAPFDTQSYQYAEPHQVSNSPYGNYGFQQSNFLQQDYNATSPVYQHMSRPSSGYGTLPYDSSMALNPSMNVHGYPATDNTFDNLYNSQAVGSATISPHALDRYDGRRNDNLGATLQSTTQRAEGTAHANLDSFRDPWRQDFGHPPSNQLQRNVNVRADVVPSPQPLQSRTLDPIQPPTTSWPSVSTSARANVAIPKPQGDNSIQDSKHTVRITHSEILAGLGNAQSNVPNNLALDRNFASPIRVTPVPHAPFLAFSGSPVDLDIKGKSMSSPKPLRSLLLVIPTANHLYL